VAQPQSIVDLLAPSEEPMATAPGALRCLHTPATPLTEGDLCDWIATATRGEAIEYHRGFLLMDRSEVGSKLPKRDRARLHDLARRAWIACELGLVHLFSVRLGEHHYQYLAVRSGHRMKPMSPLPTALTDLYVPDSRHVQ
jgi:hypothetical protein